MSRAPLQGLIKLMILSVASLTAYPWQTRHGADQGSGGSLQIETMISAIDGAYNQLSATFDVTNGGFSGAPKFPRVSEVNLVILQSSLLRQRGQHVKSGDSEQQLVKEASHHPCPTAPQLPFAFRVALNPVQIRGPTPAWHSNAFQHSASRSLSLLVCCTVQSCFRGLRDCTAELSCSVGCRMHTLKVISSLAPVEEKQGNFVGSLQKRPRIWQSSH